MHGQHHIDLTAASCGVDDDYVLPPEPPPDEETLLELLHRESGAYLIDAS